jgi:hypothetical protein
MSLLWVRCPECLLYLPSEADLKTHQAKEHPIKEEVGANAIKLFFFIETYGRAK